MIGDYVTSVKAHLYDRVVSPLLGAFTVSWVIWNYEFLFVVFSSENYVNKIKFINNDLYNSVFIRAEYWLLYPLLTTIFLVFIYPYPARYVYKFWRERQRELKEIRQQIDDEALLTVEESRKLKRLIFDAERSYEDMLTKASTEKNILESRISDLERDISARKIQNEELRERIVELEETKVDANTDRMSLLKYIADHGGSVSEDVLRSDMGWSKDKVMFHIQDAAHSKQVAVESDGKENHVSLIHEGRRILVNSGIL